MIILKVYLARVVFKFRAQCFGMLPGFNLLKLIFLLGFQEFLPFVGRFFNVGRNVKLYYVTSITKFDW